MSMIITTGDDRDDDTSINAREVDNDDDRDGDADHLTSRRNSQRGDDSGSVAEDDDEDDDKTPEELRDEIKRLRASLAKSNSTGLRRRNQLKELRAAQSNLDSSDDEDDDSDDEKPQQKKQAGLDARQAQRIADKAVKRREAELNEEHRRDLIDTKAEAALTRAGVSEKNFRLLKRELDYEDLQLLKDRSMDGLDEEIDRLRTEFPDLFKSGRAAKRRINGGDDREQARKKGPTTASQRQAAMLQGRS